MEEMGGRSGAATGGTREDGTVTTLDGRDPISPRTAVVVFDSELNEVRPALGWQAFVVHNCTQNHIHLPMGVLQYTKGAVTTNGSISMPDVLLLQKSGPVSLKLCPKVREDFCGKETRGAFYLSLEGRADGGGPFVPQRNVVQIIFPHVLQGKVIPLTRMVLPTVHKIGLHLLARASNFCA